MADDYIKRSDALSEIDEWMESVGTALIGKGLSYYAELQGCIEDCKAADVAPVVHGWWDENGRCTVCGGHAPFWCMASTYYESPYCFECGARMDKETT